eukprot:43634-Rhodomonas_salina.1
MLPPEVGDLILELRHLVQIYPNSAPDMAQQSQSHIDVGHCIARAYHHTLSEFKTHLVSTGHGKVGP